jgi:hypothetical protein
MPNTENDVNTLARELLYSLHNTDYGLGIKKGLFRKKYYIKKLGSYPVEDPIYISKDEYEWFKDNRNKVKFSIVLAERLSRQELLLKLSKLEE